ncbi:MAG TPA: potassium transporter TrkG [Ottowia sp.]|uniref:TrkH family potassium uptake protein n=1 Tax=Ottowia sp. TaxID=1898956 RepID=UPI002C29D101|nr:potassium transporter TrkG [Ottowia sp.]HMN21758.1 potassium transporter TrkG [Ottowia sp.]
MQRLAPAFVVLSWVVMGFAFAFLVPLAWDWWSDGGRHLRVWAGCFGLTLATGCWLWWRTRHHQRELSVRDGFLLVNLVWLVLPAYAALPLLLLVPGIGFTNAYFEAMSGLTATGATVLSGLDDLAPSINIWRCFLQLIGGLGIMLLAIAVLPFLGLGGAQLFKAEMPGPMKETRLTPRIAETARGLWGVYFVLSLACMLAYRWGGMSWADAFMHMCTTVGLGGLSSHDQSFGYWASPQLEWTAVLFLALSGISFMRYLMLWQRRSLTPLTRDAEVRAYFAVLLASIALVTLMLLAERVYGDLLTAVRQAAFQVLSVATGTGFSTTDYGLWPTFVPVLLLLLGCFVACAGSTGGGIKMVRMVVLIKLARRELLRIIHPRVVHPVTLNGAILPANVVAAVMAFMLIYGGVMVGLTLVLLASGLDVVTAFSAIIACLNNIGPGLGLVGPASNYGALTGFQIWVCSLAMLLGRLELLSVLVLLTPQFWRR